MAMLDYGAIAFKNGECIQTDVFTPMKDMVGWVDTKNDTYDFEGIELPLNLNDDYFAYIGDKDLTVGFYKQTMVIVKPFEDKHYNKDTVYFGCEHFQHWKRWETRGFVKNNNRDDYTIKVTKRNGYYVCKMKYKGDKYKVYFGYGVDYDYYKKWHIVNYYKYSPSHKIYMLKSRIKDIWYDAQWKWRTR